MATRKACPFIRRRPRSIPELIAEYQAAVLVRDSFISGDRSSRTVDHGAQRAVQVMVEQRWKRLDDAIKASASKSWKLGADGWPVRVAVARRKKKKPASSAERRARYPLSRLSANERSALGRQLVPAPTHDVARRGPTMLRYPDPDGLRRVPDVHRLLRGHG